MFSQAAAELDKRAPVKCVASCAQARGEIARADFDIIVIDADTSGGDALELLSDIMHRIPTAYILFTTRPSSISEKLCANAMARGASDYLIKPLDKSYNDNYSMVRERLRGTLRILRGGDARHAVGSEGVAPKKPKPKHRFKPGLVVIAASTGGPMALDKILTELNSDYPIPILIVQHMPLHFTEVMAQSLNQKSALHVKTAQDNETIAAGTVYIAPGGTHMKLNAESRIVLDNSPARG